jgi:hypothetical protein
LVVEPQEADIYAQSFGSDRLLILPENDRGLIYVRNWIKEHATLAGYERHWQLDDNIIKIFRRRAAIKIPCNAGPALAVCEDFTDRYENIAIAGLNYEMFAPNIQRVPALNINTHVYSCTLILNGIPYRWRSHYNDDTDMCLQVLAGGWCTLLLNAFLAYKVRTMLMKGGNTTRLYQGDGRLKMARALKRLWPGVVTISRKWGRPQHVVNWSKFDTPLKLKPGIDLASLPPIDEYGMKLTAVRQVKSPALQKLLAERGD